MPQKPVNETYRRGQIWEAGFDGHFNTDDALDYVTGKVGHDAVRMPPPTTFAATQQIVRERQRAAFERSVTSRAQQFKDAFRKLDLDGDGMLSFQEFSHGLQSLGVILPPQEVRAIWGEEFAGNPALSETPQDCQASVTQLLKQTPRRAEKPTGAVPSPPPARTHLKVKEFAAHRNECDRIQSNLEEHVDELWSPLKGNRRRNAAAYSMADKLAQVHDRSEKHMVVMSEKKRYGIRRRVAEQMRGQGVAFWQVFQRQFPADQDNVSFPNYKQKLQALGVVLSDEDFRHLWDLCSEQSQTRFFQGSEASSVASTGLSSSIEHADSMHAPESVSLTQLAQTVGISRREDVIGSEDQEKEKKMKKKSAIVGQKVADSLKGRQKHLRQALKISDLRQEGKLDYHEFRACLQSAGIIIGDSDCKALVGDNRNKDTGQVDYEAFLSQISENDHIHRRTQHMFRDPTCESGGIGCDDRQSHTDATSDIFAQSTHESANSADDALANRHLAGGAFRDNPPQRAHSVQALQAPPWEADPASAWEEKEPGAEKQKREAISLSKISNKLSAKMPELRRALVGDHGTCRVSFNSFHEGLHKVGVVLHTADAKALYSRSLTVDGTLDFEGLMRDRDGMPPMTSLRPSGVQGYTTSTSPGEGRAKSPQFGKRIEGEHMASRRGWANITKEALEIRDMGGGPMEEKWAMKISQSKVGNPFRLARMFRKYDTEQGKHSKTVLLDEFVQVMMDSNLEVPRGEAIKLSQELDRGDGNINYMDFIRRVKGIKANGLPPTSPESEITPRNDSEIGIEFLQGTPPLLQNQPGNVPSDLNGSVVSQASVATNETDKADKLGVVKKSLAFGSSQKQSGDRGSWIEDVVKNSMRDVAHRFETTRLRKVSAPICHGPPKVLHVRQPPPIPLQSTSNL